MTTEPVPHCTHPEHADHPVHDRHRIEERARIKRDNFAYLYGRSLTGRIQTAHPNPDARPGVDTGRFRDHEPEMQRIPRPLSPEAQEVLDQWKRAFPGVDRFGNGSKSNFPRREDFDNDEDFEKYGEVFVGIDYGQSEMRVLSSFGTPQDVLKRMDRGEPLSRILFVDHGRAVEMAKKFEEGANPAAVSEFMRQHFPDNVPPDTQGAPYTFGKPAPAGEIKMLSMGAHVPGPPPCSICAADADPPTCEHMTVPEGSEPLASDAWPPYDGMWIQDAPAHQPDYSRDLFAISHDAEGQFLDAARLKNVHHSDKDLDRSRRVYEKLKAYALKHDLPAIVPMSFVHDEVVVDVPKGHEDAVGEILAENAFSDDQKAVIEALKAGEISFPEVMLPVSWERRPWLKELYQQPFRPRDVFIPPFSRGKSTRLAAEMLHAMMYDTPLEALVSPNDNPHSDLPLYKKPETDTFVPHFGREKSVAERIAEADTTPTNWFCHACEASDEIPSDDPDIKTCPACESEDVTVYSLDKEHGVGRWQRKPIAASYRRGLSATPMREDAPRDPRDTLAFITGSTSSMKTSVLQDLAKTAAVPRWWCRNCDASGSDREELMRSKQGEDIFHCPECSSGEVSYHPGLKTRAEHLVQVGLYAKSEEAEQASLFVEITRLGPEGLMKALRNVGTEPSCGACMAVFFTGTNLHPHTCDNPPVGLDFETMPTDPGVGEE